MPVYGLLLSHNYYTLGSMAPHWLVCTRQLRLVMLALEVVWIALAWRFWKDIPPIWLGLGTRWARFVALQRNLN